MRTLTDLFRTYARADWVQSPSGVILHHLAEVEAVNEGEWCATGRSACGVRTTWRIPGMLSRMGAERCRRCCDKLGIARGIGSPKNDKALRKWLGIAVVALLTACAPALASFTGAAEAAIPGERFTPPAHYATLWAEVHADLGIPVGDFTRVRWYAAPGMCLAGDGSEETPCRRGTTYSDGRLTALVIVLAEDAIGDDGTVRHEIAHVVLGLLVGHEHPVFSDPRYCSTIAGCR